MWGLRPAGPHSTFYGLLPPSPELGCSKCALPPPSVTLMIPKRFGGQLYSEQVRNVSQTDTLVVLCSDPQQAFCDVLRHSHPLHSMAAMKKAAMKATRKEGLTISTGSSGFVFGPRSIAQSILFGFSFFFALGRGVSLGLPGGPRKSPKPRRMALGCLPGYHGARGARAQNIKINICCGALSSGRALGPVDVDSFSAPLFCRGLIVVQRSRAGDHSRLSLLIWPPSPRSKAMKTGMKKAAAPAAEAPKKAMKKAMKANK